MKRTGFTDEQIIGIVAENEAGAKCTDLCRTRGMSQGTFYNWNAKLGGMTVSVATRLKALEDENAKLKKLLADQMLDMAAMKELLSKKNGDARPEARGCRVSAGAVGSVGTAGVRDCRGGPEDGALPVAALLGYGAAGPVAGSGQRGRRFGYRRLFVLLRARRSPRRSTASTGSTASRG